MRLPAYRGVSQIHAGGIDIGNKIRGEFPAARIGQVLGGVKKIFGRLFLDTQVPNQQLRVQIRHAYRAKPRVQFRKVFRLVKWCG